MGLRNQTVVITGGAGFLGSHLADRLVAGNAVRVVDDLSNGNEAWVPAEAEFVRGDLTDPAVAAAGITSDTDVVFHFAARKDVNDPEPRAQFENNLRMTYNVLDRMRDVGVSRLAFASSSTVYGEAPTPTPETHPARPISPYGAAKTAEEALCAVHAYSHGFTAWVFRFANAVGPRLQPGSVLVDFIQKLARTPERLEILGDGRQEKSYLHVTDCVDAITHVVGEADDPLNTFNLGTRTTTPVREIASIVSDEMGLDPEYEYTGGDRGWVGDVPRMRLGVEKLTAMGWEPQLESTPAVRRAVSELVPRWA